jgi:antitoxin YefM
MPPKIASSYPRGTMPTWPLASSARAIDRILYVPLNETMKTVSYTDARNQLASLMESASEDREPVTITRNGAAAVVLVDAEEYAAMTETMHLLSSPTNARRLAKSLNEFTTGKFKKSKAWK